MTICFVSYLPLRASRRTQRLSLCHRTPPIRRLSVRAAKEDDPEPKEPHDIPQSAVDWNSEWSRFSASGMRSMAPEGREPTSKEELARQRAINNVRKVTDKLPSRQKLFADWRFWVAVIVALSLFTSFVQSTSSPLGVGSV